MAITLADLRTFTVHIMPSPEHEDRYFRRSIKYDHSFARHEVMEAAYPAIVDLGKVLFSGKKGHLRGSRLGEDKIHT